MDWIAALFELIGKFLVGDKNKWGFISSAVCNFFWIIVSLQTKLWGLTAVVIICFAMNLWNFFKWSKK